MGQPVIVKGIDEHTAELAIIERLLQSEPAASIARSLQSARTAIIRRLQQQRYSSYHLDAYFKNSTQWALIHDLRLEMGADETHIDHLLISHRLDIYVIDSKYYAPRGTVDMCGENIRTVDKQPHVVSPPVERLQCQIKFLRHYLRHNGLLPSRLGFSIQPTFHSVILTAPSVVAGQTRGAAFLGEYLIRPEQFLRRVTRAAEGSYLANFFAIAKQVSPATLSEMARRLAQRHLPHNIDYAAHYGLRQKVGVSEPAACYAS